MAELYLSRKLAVSSSPSSNNSDHGPNWHHSPNQSSKLHKSSRGSATTLQEENDVEELEMLLEVIKLLFISFCHT
jgi:magnesium transporter